MAAVPFNNVVCALMILGKLIPELQVKYCVPYVLRRYYNIEIKSIEIEFHMDTHVIYIFMAQNQCIK